MGVELWAGIECTLNRVGDAWLDQLDRSGHAHRPEDLHRVAALGVRTLRYPLLWERIAPEGARPGGLARADWSWADERMERLKQLRVEPIVGLVHHGSGPAGTSLLDPDFPERLAEFAHAVAERYPWVRRFTPVNEPLTTARFSCLYGHWYPHAADDASFARALAVQCRAVAESMRAIRDVTPAAELVQTEDIGACHGTPPLAEQAAWEDDRRWWSFDLLAGRVVPGTLAWEWMVRRAGLPEDELAPLAAAPCPPSLVGVNHYLSSERFLDHRLDRYPAHTHGGNGRIAYADLAAATVAGAPLAGPYGVLRAAWERYGLPVAVTEAHNACTREEQLRWLDDVWRAAGRLAAEGADVRAVTVWSLLGAYGWKDLLTRGLDGYEPGAYDLRGPAPRPTALAAMAQGLATEGRFDHPVLAGEGWWHRPDARWYGALPRVGASVPARRGRPVLVTGAAGTLGRALVRACVARGLPVVAMGRAELDVAAPDSVEEALRRYRPWALVNAAGYVRVDDAESDRDRCTRENAHAAAVLARATARRGVRLATFSTDLVFDGAKALPYLEHDAPRPLQHYGVTKRQAEVAVLDGNADALVVRTSAFFGPWDEHNFVTVGLRGLAEGAPAWAASDEEIVSPTYVPDLVDALLDLAIDGEAGLWHLAGPDALSWAGLARAALEALGPEVPDSAAEVIALPPGHAEARPARRPAYSALESARGTLLAPLRDALERYAWERRRAVSAA